MCAYFWDQATNTRTTRYFVIDGATGDVTVYAENLQAYSEDEYRGLLRDCGFDSIEFFPSLTGAGDEPHGDKIAVVALKRAPSR